MPVLYLRKGTRRPHCYVAHFDASFIFEKGHSKTPLLCSSLWYQFYICRSAYCVIQGPVEQLCTDQNTHSCLPHSDSAEKITVSGQWCRNTEPSIWWEDARTPCVPFVQEWFKVWIVSFSSLPFVLLLVKLYACTCNYFFFCVIFKQKWSTCVRMTITNSNT